MAKQNNNYPFPTKREILSRLETCEDFQTEALLVLYARQTEDEREVKETKWKNRRGFMSSHAVNGSRLAEKVISGEALTDEERGKVASIVCRYSKQLAAHYRAKATKSDPTLADKAACFFAPQS
jgi:hypothetical protein